MSYYISQGFTYLKTSIGGIGLLASTSMIIYGSLASGAWIYLTGGAIFMALSLFTLFDSSKVISDIKREIQKLRGNINDFQVENNILKNTNGNLQKNVDDLSNVKDKFICENKKLKDTVTMATSQLEMLDYLKEQYANANKLLFENLKTEGDHLVAFANLETNLNYLVELKNSYVAENQKLQNLVHSTYTQIQSLKKLKENYLIENKKLSQELMDLSTNNSQLHEQVDYLNEQVTKLHDLYQDSKKLLLNLAVAGDMFNQFSTTIDTNMVKLENRKSVV